MKKLDGNKTNDKKYIVVNNKKDIPRKDYTVSQESLDHFDKFMEIEQNKWVRNNARSVGNAVISPISKAKEAMSKWSWFWGPSKSL
jgi:hypothetical protein